MLCLVSLGVVGRKELESTATLLGDGCVASTLGTTGGVERLHWSIEQASEHVNIVKEWVNSHQSWVSWNRLFVLSGRRRRLVTGAMIGETSHYNLES